jgi:Predicted ester cyclase
MMRSDLRKQCLAAFIQAVWDEGRVDAADDYIAQAYVIRHDPGDPWHGQTLDRAGFKDRVRQSRAAFPDQRFAIQGLFSDGDSVVMTWLWRGTHAADLPGFTATGQTIHMSGATVYMFDADDRLTGHWQITDRLGVYQQLQRGRQEASPAS